jgi:hypothetical protein
MLQGMPSCCQIGHEEVDMKMKNGPRIALIVLLLVALLTAGAAEIAQAVGEDQPQQNDLPITEDDRLEQIAKENPGFGGYYRDRDDTSIVYVYMTDVSQRETAERAARAAVEDPESVSEIRIVQGDFEFTDLAEWFRLITKHLLPVVDEINKKSIIPGTNRIEIGVSDLSAQDRVTKVLNEMGIPVDAVTIVEFAGVRTLPDPVGIGRTWFIILLAAGGAFVFLGMVVSGYWLLKRKRGTG